MKFWNQLRWTGSALFIALALLLAVFVWLDQPDSSPAPPAASQPAPPGNSRGL